jgi:hypothetical protein
MKPEPDAMVDGDAAVIRPLNIVMASLHIAG